MQNRMVLLKTKKNEIFQILQQQGLDPANFEWKEVSSLFNINTIVSRLNYRDGHFYFQFDYSSGSDWCRYSPGEKKAVDDYETGAWDFQKNFAIYWANYLKKEIDAPDLWSELEKYKTTFSLIPPDRLLNEPIPAYETDKIKEALQALTTEIENQFKLTDDQLKFVQSRLEYLGDAAKRQGRLDWVHTCVGVFMTIVMALALAPAETTKFWQIVKTFVGQFVRLIGQ